MLFQRTSSAEKSRVFPLVYGRMRHANRTLNALVANCGLVLGHDQEGIQRPDDCSLEPRSSMQVTLVRLVNEATAKLPNWQTTEVNSSSIGRS